MTMSAGRQPTQVAAPASSYTLADAAARYANVRWPILPVHREAPEDFGSISRRELVTTLPTTDESLARDTWTDVPYGIAVAVGELFDILVIPSRIGPALASQFPTASIAAIKHPRNHWLFLVTPGSPPIEDMPRQAGIRFYRQGRYVLLPPTVVNGGALEWEIKPGCWTATSRGIHRPVLHVPHSLIAQMAVARLLFAELNVTNVATKTDADHDE
jgi:hypothetical protein